MSTPDTDTTRKGLTGNSTGGAPVTTAAGTAPGAAAGSGIPLVETPALRDTLARAEALARAYGHHYLGEEHVLAAILEGQGSVAVAAVERAAPAEAVRGHLDDILASPGYNTPSWYPARDHHAISAQCRADETPAQAAAPERAGPGRSG